MEWSTKKRKEKVTDHSSQKSMVLKMSKKDLNIYKFSDLGQHSCILYLLIRTSKTFKIKMFFFGPVWMYISWMVCTVKGNLCSSVQVWCASLAARFPAQRALSFTVWEYRLIVSVGWILLNTFLHSGEKGLEADTFWFPDVVFSNKKQQSLNRLVVTLAGHATH